MGSRRGPVPGGRAAVARRHLDRGTDPNPRGPNGEAAPGGDPPPVRLVGPIRAKLPPGAISAVADAESVPDDELFWLSGISIGQHSYK